MEKAKMNIVHFDTNDVIATSGSDPTLFVLGGFDGNSSTSLTFTNYLGQDVSSNYLTGSYIFKNNSFAKNDYFDGERAVYGEAIPFLDSPGAEYYSRNVTADSNGTYQFDGGNTFTFKQ